MLSAQSMTNSKLAVLVALVPALPRMSSTSSHTLSPGASCVSHCLIERAWSCADAQLWLRKVWYLPASSLRGTTTLLSDSQRATTCLPAIRSCAATMSSTTTAEPKTLATSPNWSPAELNE